MIVTLLYNRKTNFAWHFEMMGDKAFNERQGAIVEGGYVVVGTGERTTLQTCANIIDAFRNGNAWDNKYIIRKFNKIHKELKQKEK